MVRLRLCRTGRRNRSCWRLGAFEKKRRRDAEPIEYLGFYDPESKDEEKQVSLKRERIEYWLSVGAKPTETVASILRRNGIDAPRPK